MEYVSYDQQSLAGTPSKSWRSVTKAWPELDLCSSSSFWRYANPWRWIIENKSCRQPLVRLTVEINRDRKIQLTSQSTSTSSSYFFYKFKTCYFEVFFKQQFARRVVFWRVCQSVAFIHVFYCLKIYATAVKTFFFSVFVYISQNRIKITRKRPANWTLAYANDLCWQPLVR